MSSVTKVSKQEAIRELWKRGVLSYKLHPVQKEMYDLFYNSDKRSRLVWLLARQSGKSTLLAILACEQAIRVPNCIVKLCTDTKVHVKSIFEKIFQEITNDCPIDLKPEYSSAVYTYKFPNGSQVQLAGTDNKHYEKLRGQKAHLVLVDEAGFCSDLEDVIESVLFPTTTHTGGKIILASTPPQQSDHDFLKYMETAEREGKLTKKTVYDNPLLTPDEILHIETQMGGPNSERFRREYKCEIIKDSKTSVVPEFTDELANEITKEWPKPPFYDTYVSMDIAFKDLTAVLFAYYDFRADKIIIEDELSFQFNEKDNHLEKLASEILKKEENLWKNPLTNEVKDPYVRVSDINQIATNELRIKSQNKLNFINARKDDKASAINNLRVMLANKKIIINPRCKTLVRHLKNVKWMSASNKEVFARSPDDSHYDFVDALVYLTRAIFYTKNPYPHGYNLNLRNNDSFVSNPTGYYNNDPKEIYKRIFNIKKAR